MSIITHTCARKAVPLPPNSLRMQGNFNKTNNNNNQKTQQT